MRRVPTPKQRLWVISTLLIALVVRALIPVGFMPATDRPFSFQVCPDGFPAQLLSVAGKVLPAGEHSAAADADTLAHTGHHHEEIPADAGALAHAGHHHDAADMLGLVHHHDAPGHNHSSASAEHCVFAAAAGASAFAFAATFSAPAATLGTPDIAYVSPAFESHRYRLPQPRGPPALS